MKAAKRTVWAIAILLGAVSAGGAQESALHSVLEQLEQVHQFSGVAMAPDGKQAAWTGAAAGAKTDSVFVLDLTKPGAAAKQIAVGGRDGFVGVGVVAG